MTSSFQPSTPPDFQACIEALWVFPIKSCAGISVPQAELTPTGLAHDRAWMVVDAEGEMLTQRELPRMTLVQPELVYGAERLVELVLHARGMAALHFSAVATPPSARQPVKVRVWEDQVPALDMGAEASAWFTAFLGDSFGPLRLVRFDDSHLRASSAKWTQGLPSSNQFSDGFPMLLASTASLDELNKRLQAQGKPMVDMRRFRANVVLGHADAKSSQAINAHDEDRIGTLTIQTQAENNGEMVQLQPVKPCPRCPIPNIDPDTAQAHPDVSDTLQAYRQDARVSDALTFGMNCLPVAGIGQALHVGQRVSADWMF